MRQCSVGREGVGAGESTTPHTGLWVRHMSWGPQDGLKVRARKAFQSFPKPPSTYHSGNPTPSLE